MPSFAELKKKAEGAKDASVNKFQNTRDRYSSVPLKKTNWDPYNRTPASRPGSAGPTPSPPPLDSPAPPPPVVSRNSRPNVSAYTPPPPPSRHFGSPHVPTTSKTEEIDWTNITEEDKQVFFSWLDEFFTQYLGRPVHASESEKRAVETATTPINHVRGPPPPVARSSRPSVNANSASMSLIMSYPPPAEHGSAAADVAHYFSTSTHWEKAWYMEENAILPPHLQSSSHHHCTGSWSSLGKIKTTSVALLFSDLSLCWASVSFPLSAHNPNDESKVKRSAKFLPRPRPMSQSALVSAHETYGETIAGFAESFEGTGEFCARGECWDLAAEALKYFDQYDYVPKPAYCIRTHGHLIYEGKATSKSNGLGRWRGGDTMIRRGDIVEWRTVKIGIVGSSPGSYAILGDPEHTAVIVCDSQPSCTVADGQSIPPAALVKLEVVEQSVNQAPHRTVYDMTAFEEGEVWIYRPVGMKEYVGALFELDGPPEAHTL